VTINNPAAPTGTAAQSFCAINNPTVANLAATGTAIQWYSASSGGSALATTTALTTATTYYASQTVGGCESTSRFAVTVTINNPAAPTGTAAQSFCAINSPSVANLAATGTAIQWYSTSSGGSALATTTALTTATTYYASQTVGGCESASRFAVTVTINNPAAPTGTAAQGFCAINNPTVANLTATGTTIQWYSASSGGSALALTTALTTATTYYASQTVGGCESASRFAVTVTINNPAAPTGTATQSFCSINNPTVANLAATGTAIQWYIASSGGSALASTTALTTATTYYASQTVGGCESASRFAVTVTINNPAAPTGTTAQSFCAINNPTVANLAATGTAIQWYSASSGGSALASTAALTTATTYYASQTVGSCESASRFAVTVTINNPAAPTGTAAQSFNSTSNPSIADLIAAGTFIQWYSSPSGGSALASTMPLTAATYYASQTVAGCESVSRFGVVVAINHPPSDIALTSSTIDENQPAGMSIGNFSSTDPDVGDTFSYTLVAGPGSTDNASFAIATNVLQSASSFDFETKNTYSIRIRTTDASGLFFEKVFTITINNVNEAPTDISLSSSSVDENLAAGTTVGNFSSTDVDAGDTFTYSLVAGAGSMDNAVFIITAGVLRTNMMFDFETKNSYSIRVRSTDAGGLFFEKVFTIFVNNVNEAPLATNDNATTNEDTAINIDVLSNDTDVDNAIDPTTVTILTPSTNGTISINPSTGVVTYTPNLNYNGNDSFTYTVKDIAAATSNIATVTIVILPVNDAPVANSDAVTTPENTGIDISVLVNDTDVDSALDPTTVVIVSGALHGTLVIDPGTGTIKYTPSTGYYGIDSFTYTVRDAGGLISNVATVTITVIQTDVPPVAVDDGPILIENIKPFVIDVLANDYDPDGSSTDLSILSVSSATMGSVTIENGKIIYQAYKNVSGDDHFTYIIQDAMGLTDTATVTIHYEYLELQVSQGFSPNGDGNNDTWYIKSIENYANNSIKVFDRWGMTVYEAQPYDNSKGWNGHANTGQQSGKMLEEDTYYYILNAGDKTLSGFITLVR
jgi:gliding motility-associated-like protein